MPMTQSEKQAVANAVVTPLQQSVTALVLAQLADHTLLPNAANDGAAAALTPAVPVDGLYRNGSVLMIRVA